LLYYFFFAPLLNMQFNFVADRSFWYHFFSFGTLHASNKTDKLLYVLTEISYLLSKIASKPTRFLVPWSMMGIAT